MRDSIADYEKLDAQILAVSVDSPFTLAKWKEEQGFNFPLLSDFNKTVSKKYDSLYKEFGMGLKGVSKRSAFVMTQKVLFSTPKCSKMQAISPISLPSNKHFNRSTNSFSRCYGVCVSHFQF